MKTNFPKIEKYNVVSDVGDRNGIGIEIYSADALLIEIFRNDNKKTREISLYKKDLDLELVEQAINLFKQKIPEDYMN